jgi:hypothetical protein
MTLRSPFTSPVTGSVTRSLPVQIGASHFSTARGDGRHSTPAGDELADSGLDAPVAAAADVVAAPFSTLALHFVVEPNRFSPCDNFSIWRTRHYCLVPGCLLFSGQRDFSSRPPVFGCGVGFSLYVRDVAQRHRRKGTTLISVPPFVAPNTYSAHTMFNQK